VIASAMPPILWLLRMSGRTISSDRKVGAGIDVGREAFAIDGAVEDARRGDAAAA
jgi:hypothetical protein